MPSIDVIDPLRIRALYLRWLDLCEGSTRMDIAVALAEIDHTAGYKQRQVASSRLSGALAGKENVSRTRWSHWLYLAERMGIPCADLREDEINLDDPRLKMWPLPSRRASDLPHSGEESGEMEKESTEPEEAPEDGGGMEVAELPQVDSTEASS